MRGRADVPMVATAASLLPALRATHTDPITVIRSD